MFGPRLTRIFASRWMALWWAATILFLAWQLVPASEDEVPDPVASAAAQSAANPWVLATAAPVKP